MAKGFPAMAVLVASIGVGIHLGQRMARHEDHKPKRLIVLSVATGLVSLVFFIWATTIYATQHFDLGVFTFPLALGASLYGAGFLDRFVPLTTSTYRVVAFSGYGAVAANYLLGFVVFFDKSVFATYLGLGTLAWSAATVHAALIAREGGLASESPQYSRL